MTLLPTPTSRDHKGHNQRGDTSCLTGALLPTPRASDTGTPGRRASEGFRPPLSEVLLTQLLPTPTVRDGISGPGHSASAEGTPDLRTAVTLLPTPRARDVKGAETAQTRDERVQRGTAHKGYDLPTALTLLPAPRATDGSKGGPNQRGSSGDLMLPSAVVQLLPTPTVRHEARNATANRTAVKPTTNANGWTLSDVAYADRWGNYGPAIRRWEAITGRTAPEPTEPGTKGQPRLAPAFVEWLMGLPAGWVTDHLPRNPALKCLGNGVVWQQAAHAYTELLAAA